MKIKTITYIERKNLGNYEFAELSSVAELFEGEDEAEAVVKLMEFVTSSLSKEASNLKIQPQKEVIPVIEPVVEPVVEQPKKEKKPRVKKEKPIEVKEEVATPVAKNVVAYDSNIPEHKSIFGGYLSKKYDNAWKTVKPAEEIKAFTASLNGKHFLDNDGKIVDSFLELVHGFFG